MTTWLLEGGLAVGLFVLLAPVFIVPLLGVIYRRYRYAPLLPTGLAVSTGLYLCALVAFTAFPLPSDPEGFCAERAGISYWQLSPGASLADVADRLREAGIAATLTSGVFLQVAFNVLFFVPLGFLVAYWWRRGLAAAAVVGLGTSLLIEVSQGTALWGLYPCPYRLADVDDLVTNTLGALLGWALGAAVSRRWPFRDPEPRDDTGAPSLRRRVLAAVLDLVLVSVIGTFVGAIVIIVYEVRGGLRTDLPDWLGMLPGIVGTLLLLVVPLIRHDRATPGQSTLLLVLRAADGGPAPVWSVLVRFLVRWLPILVWGVPAALVVLLVDLVTAWRSSMRRSATAILSRTRVETRSSVAGGADSSAEPPATT